MQQRSTSSSIWLRTQRCGTAAVGAYRTTSRPAHPLLRTLGGDSQGGSLGAGISLAPLAREDLGRLIADTLSCDAGPCAPLRDGAREDGGNPFFAIRSFLRSRRLPSIMIAARWRWSSMLHAKGIRNERPRSSRASGARLISCTRLPLANRLQRPQKRCAGRPRCPGRRRPAAGAHL